MPEDPAPTAAPARRSQAPLGPSYWRLWGSSALSNLADGILKVALPLLAIRFTRSPGLIAGVTVAFTLPWLLAALPAGAHADRVDRRRAMLVANGLRASLLGLFVLALAVDAGSIVLLYALALCVGTTETVYDTCAQSILPQVVHRDRLPRANGRLFAAELTANQFVGPPVGGVLVAAGAVFAFAAPALLWVVAVGVLLLVPGEFRVTRVEPTTLRADIVEGLQFLWRHRVLRTAAIMAGLFNLCANAVFAVLVLYAVGPASPMGLSEATYGALIAATAAGSLLGSFLADHLQRALGRARSLTLSILAGTLLAATPALTANPITVGAAFFVSGIGIVTWNVVTVSLRQRVTPDRLLGRVNSGSRLVVWGTMPLGAAAGGAVAQAFGLRTVFVVTTVVLLASLAGMRVLTDERMDAADAAPLS